VTAGFLTRVGVVLFFGKYVMSSDPLINRRFGPYILLRQLGIGGMAETYLAVKRGPQGARKFVALKCILSHYNDMPDYIDMFYHEAGLSLKMQHPNVISAWDVGLVDGRHTMVMEYLRGATLESILLALRARGEVLPIEVGVWLAISVLDGLQYLYDLKSLDGLTLRVVHRDITPQNIFACYNGQSKIFDFGIACLMREGQGVKSGMLVGKYAYMSPEQCRGEALDARSDMFALAAVLYEMTTGRPVFERENDIKTLEAVTTEPIKPPASVVRDFPAFLSGIIMHGLERDISRRYPTALEFADELRTFMKVAGYTQTGRATRLFLGKLFAEEIAASEVFAARAIEAVWQKFPEEEDEALSGASVGECGFENFLPVHGGSVDISLSKLGMFAVPSSEAGKAPAAKADGEQAVAVGGIWRRLTVILAVALLFAVVGLVLLYF